MTTATQAGQAGLQGWRAKVADAAFFVLAVIYVTKTVWELVQQEGT
jgi:hypothetical protein